MDVNKVYFGDCLSIMKQFPDNCIDTIITDPPYGMKIFNKNWDYSVPSVEYFQEMLRVIKPSGTLLCFGGRRTFHRVAVNIEDSGFFINDVISWIYGSGFPKSVDISYMIDKNKGTLGTVKQQMNVNGIFDKNKKEIVTNEPESEEAKLFYGWGTALKPAWEPIIMANKHIEGNYDDNAIKWGVAGLNIDGGRFGEESFGIKRTTTGRYPSNLIIDKVTADYMDSINYNCVSRFFYSAKSKDKVSKHPTKKPIELMDYLCKLTKTPFNDVVLDPFAGSGITGKSCINTGRNYILIEKELEYFNEIKDGGL